MAESFLSPELTALLTTVISIVLTIVAAKFKTQHTAAKNILSMTSKKTAQFQKVITKLIEANEDTEITTEEYNGIVSAVKELIDLSDTKQ